jgi:NAD(P)H-hydrate epimerase
MNITLTREQVRRVDELAIHRYGITGLVLMENAGRNAAAIIDRAYGPSGRAVIFCGSGNNGGDGCVIARHLHNAGWSVRVVLAGDVSRMTPDTSANYRVIETMGLAPHVAVEIATQQAAASSITPEDIAIDALLGTGFSGEVRSPLAELIHAINSASKRAVVAVDLPSGLDCDTGTPGRSTIRADLSITFVARKRGFDSPEAVPYLGRIEVADIGAPRALVAEVAAGLT